MPAHNAFRHQRYSAEAPRARYTLLRPPTPAAPGSAEFTARMAAVGERLRRHRVAAVYLVHGTFVGDDSFGMLGALERALPRAGRFLRRRQKALVDALAGDSGNYTEAFARLFETALNGGRRRGQRRIPVRPFYWSSENHHAGRCDGALRLLYELRRDPPPAPGSRVLLWGHSHAGNLFALLTNLAAADRALRARFFHACRRLRQPFWDQLDRVLEGGSAAPALDLVTFGTPPRYGWDSGGYARLLHIVQHRPQPGLPEYRCGFPFSVDDILSARGGDYIQQIGIAGTDFRPSLLRFTSWYSERRIGRMLQPGPLRYRRRLLAHLRLGQRVPDEGECLLIDYPADADGLNRLFAGHAIYTRSEWLLFHAEQTARAFYD